MIYGIHYKWDLSTKLEMGKYGIYLNAKVYIFKKIIYFYLFIKF